MDELSFPVHYESKLDELIARDDISDILFNRMNFDQMEFCMSPAKNAEDGRILRKFKKLVEMGGGILRFNLSAGGLYMIKLVHFKCVSFRNEDYFLSQYLLDCIEQNKLQRLELYRASKTKFPNISPSDILCGTKTWEDAQKSGLCDRAEEVSDDFSEDEDMVPQRLKSVFKSSESRRFYSVDEERNILNFIILRKYYFKVKGNTIWQTMEKEKICCFRTWQSMKERYLHHIIPRLKQFKLHPLVEAKLLKPFNNAEDSFSVIESFQELEARHKAQSSPKKTISEKATFENQTECGIEIAKEQENVADVSSKEHENESEKQKNTSRDTSYDKMDGKINPMATVSSPSRETINENNTSQTQSKIVVPNQDTEEREKSISTYTQPFEVQVDPVVNLGNRISCRPKEIVHMKSKPTCSTDSPKSYCANIENELNKINSDCETEIWDSDDDNDAVICNLSEVASKHATYNNAFESGDDMEIPLQIDKSINKQQEESYDDVQAISNLKKANARFLISKQKLTNHSIFCEPSTSSGLKVGNFNKIVSENETDSSDASHLSHRLRKRTRRSRSRDSNSNNSRSASQISQSKNYTEKEDMEVLKYIYKNGLFKDVKGKAMWEDMERNKVLPGRSWHSLKERFRKRILPRIKSYKNLSEKVVEGFVGYAENESESRQQLVKYRRYEDDTILKFIINNKRYSEIKGKSMWISMSKNELRDRSWESLKNRFLKTIVPDLNRYRVSQEVRKSIERVLNDNPSKQHNKYSKVDDDAILDFIIRYKRFREIKGKSMWVSMSVSHFRKARTWESLKNRFLQVISPNLGRYNIDQEDASKIEKALSRARKKLLPKKFNQKIAHSLRKENNKTVQYEEESSSDEESSFLLESSDEDIDSDQENKENGDPKGKEMIDNSDEIYSSTDYEDNYSIRNKIPQLRIEETSLTGEEHLQLRLESSGSSDKMKEIKNQNLNKDENLDNVPEPSNESLYPLPARVERKKLFNKNNMFRKLYEKTPVENEPQHKRKKIWSRKQAENVDESRNIVSQGNESQNSHRCSAPLESERGTPNAEANPESERETQPAEVNIQSTDASRPSSSNLQDVPSTPSKLIRSPIRKAQSEGKGWNKSPFNSPKRRSKRLIKFFSSPKRELRRSTTDLRTNLRRREIQKVLKF